MAEKVILHVGLPLIPGIIHCIDPGNALPGWCVEKMCEILTFKTKNDKTVDGRQNVPV